MYRLLGASPATSFQDDEVSPVTTRAMGRSVRARTFGASLILCEGALRITRARVLSASLAETRVTPGTISETVGGLFGTPC